MADDVKPMTPMEFEILARMWPDMCPHSPNGQAVTVNKAELLRVLDFARSRMDDWKRLDWLEATECPVMFSDDENEHGEATGYVAVFLMTDPGDGLWGKRGRGATVRAAIDAADRGSVEPIQQGRNDE